MKTNPAAIKLSDVIMCLLESGWEWESGQNDDQAFLVKGGFRWSVQLQYLNISEILTMMERYGRHCAEKPGPQSIA